MSKRRKRAYADYLANWKHLIATAQAIPELADSRHKATLESAVDQFVQLKTTQAQAQAAKQVATVELADLVQNSKDAVRDLTAQLRSHFGSRSEELVQFRVRPLRGR